MSEKELKELEGSFMGPYSKYPLEEGLNLEYLEVLRSNYLQIFLMSLKN